jgi:hypothetical protein
VNADREWERLKLDYERTLETYRQLAEVRFKLLAFVPAFSGAAIALLAQTTIEDKEKAVLAGLGFVVTLGIVLYDQRNTDIYYQVIDRATHLEAELKLKAYERDGHPGHFGARHDIKPWRLFRLLPVDTDYGLSLVYSSVLGTWAFAIVQSARPTAEVVPVLIGTGVAVLALIQFLWHRGKPKSLWSWWRTRKGKRTMQRNEDILKKLNQRIGDAEADGDRDFLDRSLAPVFAFRRAGGALIDRITFLDGVKPSARRETEIEFVNLFGRDRAVVGCMVSVIEDDRRTRFHNIRLFVRSNEGEWKLLGWANEPIS